MSLKSIGNAPRTEPRTLGKRPPRRLHLLPFHHRRGARPDFVTKFTQRVANKMGIKLTPKALRHFSATELVAAGVDVRTVAGRMGHADPSMTLQVYSHRRAQRDREAAALLGKTLRAYHLEATTPTALRSHQ